MEKQFYSHLIAIDDILNELETVQLSPEEKAHLITIIHSSMHTVVIDIILTQIPQEDKQLFLEQVYQNSHSKIWEFINKRTINVEEKIRKATKELKHELLEDIQELKKDKS